MGRRIRIKRRGLPALIIIFCLAFPGTANAFYRSDWVESHEPTPRITYCAESQAEWKAEMERIGASPFAVGITYMLTPDREIYLSADICFALSDPVHTGFGSAVHILNHEWVHSFFGLRDEGETECISLFFHRYSLRNFWGVDRGTAEVLYKRAVFEHNFLAMLFPQYRGDCEFPQPDPVN